jgi:sucrose-6-phosphate hydrolase SacC (GH32 family)
MYDEWQLRRERHKRWGHAVSSDLIHWKQMPGILDTQRDNHPGSGSGTVDWSNCSGLQQGTEKTLMVFYTDYKLGTCISYSRDAGQTWAYFDKNPVLADAKDKRDPLVFWHKPTRKWCMVRYESRGFAFYNSYDLLHWSYLSRIEGFYECPDMMELPVENKPDEKAWVLIDGDGSYFLGRFDGKTFTPESERLKVDFGGHYATQTWKKPGDTYSRPVQAAWMPYPNNEITQTLTWNGQLSFPCELYLRAFDGEVRLCREPIQGIKDLYNPKRRTTRHDLEVMPGENPLKDFATDPCELVLDIQAIQGKSFTLSIGAASIEYDAEQRRLSCLGKVAKIPGNGKGLYLQVLVDRSSVDVYAEHGRATLSRVCFPMGSENRNLALASAEGGRLKVGTLEVNYLTSMWASAASK